MIHKKLNLTNDQVIEMYKSMLLTRKVDEINWVLNRAGKLPFVVSGQGHEAAQVALAYALDRSKDYIAPYYRDLGVVLSWGVTVKEIMLSFFAKAEDPISGGRQMPNHFGYKKLRMLSGSSPVATQLTHAVGVAYALKMDGINDVVCMTALGEGSTNQGDFHDALNFASIYKLPVVFVCENNEYAISTKVDKQVACENVADRAKGYNMPGVVVDGLDLFESYKASKDAVDLARTGGGPTLLEFKVKRLTAHSSDDNAVLYMTKDEIKDLKSSDPLLKIKQYIFDNKIITEKQHEEIVKNMDKEIKEATEYAENAPFATPSSALQNVYE